jgi:hypothetical protein
MRFSLKITAPALLSVAAIFFSAIPSTSANPPKSGALCSKAGLTKNYQGKKYTCVKSGKKLVWNKGNAIQKTLAAPTPSSSPTPTPAPTPISSPTPSITTSNTLASSPINLCEIKEDNNFRNTNGSVIAGFPGKSTIIPKSGTVKLALIPIDWSDLPGESDWENRVRDQITLFNEYWRTISGNKVKFEWNIQKTWIRMPGVSRDYSVPYSEAMPDTTKFFEKVVPVVDAKFDFTGIDIVHFIAPKSQNIIPESTQVLHPQGMTNHPLKNVKAMTIVGKFFDQETMGELRTYWSYWAVETGHVFEFARLGNGRGSFPMQGLDLMGMQDGPSRTLSGWWRFLSGWLEPEQILCLPKERVTNAEVTLRPIDEDGAGLKLIVIPLSGSEALLVESRRKTKFDIQSRRNLDGVLVYKYNAKLGHLQNFFVPFAPASSAEDEDAYTGQVRYIMKEKDFVTEEGIKIEFKSSASALDKIGISLAESNIRPTPRPQPSPTTTDFDRVPEMSGGIDRLTEFTGSAEYWGRYFNSYRIYVTKKSDPNSTPIFDTGFVNDYRFPVKVTITNLTCSRDLFAVVRFYSGLNGTGKVFAEPGQENQLSAVEIRDGKCYGHFNAN